MSFLVNALLIAATLLIGTAAIVVLAITLGNMIYEYLEDDNA